MLRFIAALTAFMLILSLGLPTLAQEETKLNIVCTTFPIYDWVRNILGERQDAAELRLLQDSGVDLHNYQPTAQDIIAISSADLFVYIGGESDGWVEAAIWEAQNRRMVSVSLVDVLGKLVKNELVVEGMQEGEHGHEHGEEHDEEHGDDHDHDAHEHDEHEHDEHEHDEHEHEEHEHTHEHEHDEPDEHVWLSLKNAQAAVRFLRDILMELDKEKAAVYEQNAQAYIDRLGDLDRLYVQSIGQKKEPVLLFADRFPFRYLMDDYGIGYYAAFSGCSAETEASFATIAFLASKVDELELPAVISIDGSDQSVAQAVIQASEEKNQRLLRLNSMQSTSWPDVEAGADYLDIMKNNLDTILQAL